MTTKAADEFSAIARRMRYLGLDRDEPQAVDRPFVFTELTGYTLIVHPGGISRLVEDPFLVGK